MHELSLVKALIDAVNHYAKAHLKKCNEGSDGKYQTKLHSNEHTSVKSITLEVGEMTCVEPERLRFCFDLLKTDCGLSHASLVICIKPVAVQCSHCLSTYHPTYLNQPCACGGYQHSVLSGEQLNLTEIEFN